jgi:hypothetical protein
MVGRGLAVQGKYEIEHGTDDGLIFENRSGFMPTQSSTQIREGTTPPALDNEARSLQGYWSGVGEIEQAECILEETRQAIVLKAFTPHQNHFYQHLDYELAQSLSTELRRAPSVSDQHKLVRCSHNFETPQNHIFGKFGHNV